MDSELLEEAQGQVELRYLEDESQQLARGLSLMASKRPTGNSIKAVSGKTESVSTTTVATTAAAAAAAGLSALSLNSTTSTIDNISAENKGINNTSTQGQNISTPDIVNKGIDNDNDAPTDDFLLGEEEDDEIDLT